MTSALANFSSLLEIAFGLSALAGFVQNRLAHRLENYDMELLQMRSDYKEEADVEIYTEIDSVKERFSKHLNALSNVIQIAILSTASASILLLFLSAIDTDFGYSPTISVILVVSLIAVPIFLTAGFSILLDVRYFRAKDNLRSLMLKLEKEGLHVDGNVSMIRMGRLFGAQPDQLRGGISNWVVRKILRYKTLTVDFDDEDETRISDMRKRTGQTSEEVIQSSIAFMSFLLDKKDGYIVRTRDDGRVKKIPIDQLLKRKLEEQEEFIESLPWEEPTEDEDDDPKSN